MELRNEFSSCHFFPFSSPKYVIRLWNTQVHIESVNNIQNFVMRGDLSSLQLIFISYIKHEHSILT